MPDERELNAMLDEALAGYVDQEPDASLRARIMAQAGEIAPSQKRLWLFAPAALCAAALALAFLLHPITRAPRPEPSSETSTAVASPSPAPVKALPPQAIHIHAAIVAQHIHHSERPIRMRKASFPFPTPLTAQEEILLKFATEHPEQARQVLAAPSSRPVQNPPLAIASINIAPLSETSQAQHWQ